MVVGDGSMRALRRCTHARLATVSPAVSPPNSTAVSSPTNSTAVSPPNSTAVGTTVSTTYKDGCGAWCRGGLGRQLGMR